MGPNSGVNDGAENVALIFTQTDTAADNGATAGCSGLSTATGPISRETTSGSAAGSTPFTVTVGNTETNVYSVIWQTDTDEPGQVLWNSGDYVVRMNVTTANTNLQWVGTYICERTAGGTYNSVASLTGQTTSLGTTGVKTHTVNRGTDFNAAASTSTLYIVCALTNVGKGGQSVEITPNQNIDTPITQVEPLIVTTSPASSSMETQNPVVIQGTILYTPAVAESPAATQNPDVVQSSLSLTPAPASAQTETANPRIPTIIVPGPVLLTATTQNPVIIQSSLSILPSPSILTAATQGPITIQSSLSLTPEPASAQAETQLGSAAGGIPQRLTSVTSLVGVTRIHM